MQGEPRLRPGLACIRASKAPDMNAILPNPMLEATRLTREGRLTEATALLQRLFRGEAPADTAAATPQDTAGTGGRTPAAHHRRRSRDGRGVAPPRPEPRATAAGRWPAGGLGTTTMPQMPEALRGFLDQINQGGLAQGLGGLTQGRRHGRPSRCRTAPSSWPGPSPTRPAAAATSSTSPAPIAARRCRWSSCCTAAPSRPTTSPPARG